MYQLVVDGRLSQSTYDEVLKEIDAADKAGAEALVAYLSLMPVGQGVNLILQSGKEIIKRFGVDGLKKVVGKLRFKQIVKWSRTPRSIQDRLTLNAAKKGEGEPIKKGLGDPRYKGMVKLQHKIKSKNGKDSVVHYVKDLKTGKLMDFKFTKHSTGEIPK
ncbi:hypothetical protein CRYPA_510 [uncultured Candidatus Thioglobus sp.]|nr:hypothetical protein CRYPA_510 [uncultured Candidatus Thioglobus sp.]